MNIRNVSDVEDFISDSSQYKGEIFVNINNASFNDIKNFLDAHNLIAFIPSENTIYAQNHKYKGLTDAQLASLSTFASNIEELQHKVNVVNPTYPTDYDNQSLIGSLTYGSGDDMIVSSNVTQFVISVLNRIESGDSAIAEELENINNKLAGINGTVKNYVDTNIAEVVSAIQDLNLILAQGTYATRVIADNEDNFIKVDLVQTLKVIDGVTSIVPPFTYKVSSKDTIASKTDIQQLSSTLQNKISEEVAKVLGEGNINEAYDTIKEISDWITNHPNSTQVLEDIDGLKQKVNNLLGNVTEEVINEETQELVTVIKHFTEGPLSGTNWAVSIEEVNRILASVSFAQDVQDHAEANKINELEFALQNVVSLTGDNTDTQVPFGSQTLDAETKKVNLSLDTSLLEKIKQYTLSLAATDAQAKDAVVLNAAKEYTDDKLSWITV